MYRPRRAQTGRSAGAGICHISAVCRWAAFLSAGVVGGLLRSKGLVVVLGTAPVMIACPCCHTAAGSAATSRTRIVRRWRGACCLWAASSCRCRRWRRHSRRPLEQCCRRREDPSTWGLPRGEWVRGVSVLRLKPFSAVVFFAVVANGHTSFAARPRE